MMTYKTICGMQLSELALGSGKRGTPDTDKAVFAVMDKYREYGGNCFDSARMYANGESDKALGRYLKATGARDDMILIAKGCFPADKSKMYISRLSPSDIRYDLEESLRAMDTDHADFYLLHRDDPHLPVDDIMITLDKLVKEGLTRAVGCSNWTVGRIIEANEFARANGLAEFSMCQLHYSLAMTTAAQTKDVTHVPMSDVEMSWYAESQFPIMGFGPHGRGYFKRVICGEPMREGDIRYYDRIPENRRRAERLKQLSERTGRSTASLCLAYTRDNVADCIPLSGYSTVEQLDDAFDCLNYHLTKEEIAFLEGRI